MYLDIRLETITDMTPDPRGQSILLETRERNRKRHPKKKKTSRTTLLM